MGNEEKDSVRQEMAELLKPVLRAMEQVLTVMPDVRVAQNQLENSEKRLDRLEAAIEALTTSVSDLKDSVNTGLRSIDQQLATKADKTDVRQDLQTLDGHARANANHTHHMMGAASVLGGLSGILGAIAFKFFSSSK